MPPTLALTVFQIIGVQDAVVVSVAHHHHVFRMRAEFFGGNLAVTVGIMALEAADHVFAHVIHPQRFVFLKRQAAVVIGIEGLQAAGAVAVDLALADRLIAIGVHALKSLGQADPGPIAAMRPLPAPGTVHAVLAMPFMSAIALVSFAVSIGAGAQRDQGYDRRQGDDGDAACNVFLHGCSPVPVTLSLPNSSNKRCVIMPERAQIRQHLASGRASARTYHNENDAILSEQFDQCQKDVVRYNLRKPDGANENLNHTAAHLAILFMGPEPSARSLRG